jgi:hypothetical protein
MDVSETELREMVRAAIRAQALRLGPSGLRSGQAHASHAQLLLPRGGDDTGACVIEPSVRCTHCGYCLSFGH